MESVGSAVRTALTRLVRDQVAEADDIYQLVTPSKGGVSGPTGQDLEVRAFGTGTKGDLDDKDGA